VLGVALLGAVTPVCAQQPLSDVRMVSTDTLRDVAVTTHEGGRSVIYYNPELIARLGPLVRDFFIAHEYGHVFHGHTGGALAEPGSRDQDRRLRQELEADCYAASQLARDNRASVEAALRLFTRMGPFRYDQLHPTGSQRAAKILACLPPLDAPELPAGRRRVAPTSDATVVELSTEVRARLWGSIRVALDGRTVGTLSTVGLTNPLRLRHLRPGVHQYELIVQVFMFDETLTLNPGGEIRAGGTVNVDAGSTFEIRWDAGEPPSLRPTDQEGMPLRD
jgi:hypothetical protein